MFKKSLLLSMVVVALLAATIALFRIFVFDLYSISSSSMSPTLNNGDILIAKKFALSLVHGDVIVFKRPKSEDSVYVMRLIGMPGDRVQMKESELYLNGELVERIIDKQFINKPVEEREYGPRPYQETLPNGVRYNILDDTMYSEWDNTDEYVVPDGHYFVMGDNRDMSLDSRSLERVGYIPRNHIVGTLSVVLGQ